jgi:hypothetical protein
MKDEQSVQERIRPVSASAQIGISRSLDDNHFSCKLAQLTISICSTMAIDPVASLLHGKAAIVVVAEMVRCYCPFSHSIQ